MLESISSVQLAEWQAFYALNHLGEHPNERADLRSAIVAASALNAPGRKKPVKVIDMMPKFGDQKKHQSPDELRASMLKRAAPRKGATVG